MKAAFYTGTRSPWYVGLGNVLARWRLRSPISHVELVFEPGDGVDAWMPDDSCAPTAEGLWCASSSNIDVMPAWSERRAGRRGGVRFKRIALKSEKWVLVDLNWLTPAQKRQAARYLRAIEGAPYDRQGVAGFLIWLIPPKTGRYTCHAAVAAALGINEAHRLDPASLAEVLSWRARGGAA